MAFKPVSSQINFADQEKDITAYWKEQDIFGKSIEQRPADKRWTFLDGPPFVTGMPHYGSLLSSLPKDAFGRYWTMKGYRVRRVWGWDGHGLPIENKVENELEITRKRDIEEIVGVKRFIDECKRYVNVVSGDWEWYIDRIGRWADFEHAYKTWDTPYMESVMWVFKQMYDQGHIYKGLKVSLYCPHCATPISNFEVAMDADNYQEVNDPATTYKYAIVGQPDTFILAWSTTPWNKIVTPALAVNPSLTYAKVKQGDEYYILAETTLAMLDVNGAYEVVSTMPGSELVGLRFEPHYDYYADRASGKLFEIVGADFVTADEGTGVVTLAAYGEDDLRIMQELGIHVETHLDEEGTIKADVPQFGGLYYLKANKAVEADLEQRGLIYHSQQYAHRVPLCWRCHTRLYYAPINAWYVNIQNLKPQLLAKNQEVNWYPAHFKEGRFAKSIASAPDWNISRNRYWGSPIPVWECQCGWRFVPGSIKELEEASGRPVTDLHKPEIDEVVVTCADCGQKVHRVPEVLDSWIEAGSASFAERHYPFAGDDKLEDFFPPDFIAEYTGQIRAWFYVLHVIGVALYQSPAFKNVIVEGVILGTDGRKMSKNFKNYPDPAQMLDTYGGDALRLYLLGSPVMNGEDMLISEQAYAQQVRGTLLILWNCYNFFVTYANLDKWTPEQTTESANVLDKWIVSRLSQTQQAVTESLDAYSTTEPVEMLKNFITEFSTWYIRRSRDRVGPTAVDQADKAAFYSTCYQVLTIISQLLAPIAPFISEAIYMNITEAESVHLTDWPEIDESLINLDLEQQMQLVRQIVEVGHAAREAQQLKLKQPLAAASYQATEQLSDDLLALAKDELNVLDLQFDQQSEAISVNLDTTVTQQLQEMGQARELIRAIQAERKKLGCQLDARIVVEAPEWPASQAEDIKRQTLADDLHQGPELKVEVVP